MSVYVDALVFHENSPLGSRKWSHMIADTRAELHFMASKIGMKREWFQDSERCPHYDLVESRRKEAVRSGAIECDRKTFVGHMRRIREAGLHGG